MTSPQVAVHHRTTYSFDRAVVASPHILRLRPVASPWTAVLHHEQRVAPAEHLLHWQQDPFGNHVARVSFLGPISGIDIEVEIVAELTPRNPFDFLLDPSAELWPFAYGEMLSKDLGHHLDADPAGPLVTGFLADIDRSPRPTIGVLGEVGLAVAGTVRHEVRTETGILSTEETLRRGTASCRDSAWLMVQVFRHLGARGAVRLGSPRRPAPRPATSPICTHGPTSISRAPAGSASTRPRACFTAEGHIPLAVAPYPEGTAPVVGTTEPCRVELVHTNSVRRLIGDERLPNDGGKARNAPLTQTIRRTLAHRASSWRDDSCSLRSTDDACVSTVLTEMCSAAAISLYAYPRARYRITSCSRGVSWSSSGSAVEVTCPAKASSTKPASRGENTASPSATRCTASTSSSAEMCLVT